MKDNHIARFIKKSLKMPNPQLAYFEHVCINQNMTQDRRGEPYLKSDRSSTSSRDRLNAQTNSAKLLKNDMKGDIKRKIAREYFSNTIR